MEFAADPWDYLAASEAVDIEHELIVSLAAELRTGDDLTYARLAFEHVRDKVTHSMDTGDPRVTWRASDVLEQRTGLCYAQAHALTALLRAGGIQAGLCYQRLSEDGTFFLHGLVATLIDDRWVRLDPRSPTTEFSASEDRLAYTPDPSRGESDGNTIHAEPLPAVLEALKTTTNTLTMKLPDAALS
ncbi:transglutaminase-like domain-containing protein [Spirillospora sp. CA-294931]|uniref:transglutaminase-like domain-containing protein n=1 Tax=Spirillospora sp. CA-294931 TaxID=3240042 RepID=UPI003D92B2DF